MKKLLPLILSVPLLLLSSCKSNEIDKSKIKLDIGSIHHEDLTSVYQFDELDYDNLDAYIHTEENFVLLTFHNRMCGCWTEFAEVVVEYANKYHYDFKIVDVEVLKGQKNKFGIYTGEDMMPGICFFRRGKLIRQTIYGKLDENNRKMFKRLDMFEQYMQKNVYLPKMYWLDEETLKAKMDNYQLFNLYIAKKSCGDCKAINKKVVFPWAEKVTELNDYLYLFNIEQFSPEIYQSKKDEYGLSVTGDSTFGFDNGYVPTFQRRQGYGILDMITVLNDHVDKTSETPLKLISYFNADRIAASSILKNTGSKYLLDGKQMQEKDITAYGTVAQDLQMTWHKEIVELFFSTYVN